VDQIEKVAFAVVEGYSRCNDFLWQPNGWTPFESFEHLGGRHIKCAYDSSFLDEGKR
jgi:hypothetical protein